VVSFSWSSVTCWGVHVACHVVFSVFAFLPLGDPAGLQVLHVFVFFIFSPILRMVTVDPYSRGPVDVVRV
jgi:hypothetical protein